MPILLLNLLKSTRVAGSNLLSAAVATPQQIFDVERRRCLDECVMSILTVMWLLLVLEAHRCGLFSPLILRSLTGLGCIRRETEYSEKICGIKQDPKHQQELIIVNST
jgi:hypothetical protein